MGQTPCNKNISIHKLAHSGDISTWKWHKLIIKTGATKSLRPTYDISSGKMEGAIRIASLTGKNTSITIKLP